MFGHVVDGMKVVDAIAALDTKPHPALFDVPTPQVLIKSVRCVKNCAGTIEDAAPEERGLEIRPLTY